MNRKQFRRLIVILFVLFTGSCFVDLVFTGLVPESLRTPHEAYMDARASLLPFLLLPTVMAYSAFQIIGTLLSLTGLFNFHRWGRNLYTIIAATIPLNALIGGVTLSSWVGNFFDWVYLIVAGMALGAAWFSPLKEEFDNKSPKAETH